MIPRSLSRWLSCRFSSCSSSSRRTRTRTVRCFTNSHDKDTTTAAAAASSLPSYLWNDPATAAALYELGLSSPGHSCCSLLSWTRRDLRLAYFAAAKQCHPDANNNHSNDQTSSSNPAVTRSSSSSNNSNTTTRNEDAGERFRRVTQAHDFLQNQLLVRGKHDDDDDEEADDEIANYRQACLDWLGQPADVVEESKQCPAFRQWLTGCTDAAFHWHSFFMLHGGLAPRQTTTTTHRKAPPPNPLLLHANNDDASSSSRNWSMQNSTLASSTTTGPEIASSRRRLRRY